MPLKAVLHCEKSFRTKAQYTFEMLALMIGETVQIVEEEQCKSPDIVLCYGRSEDDRRFPGRHIVITGCAEAWYMFNMNERYIHDLARRCTVDGVPSLALFYDRVFLENPELIVEKKGREIVIHIDIIASAFFFFSGWQEWRPLDTDIHRRFPFESSIQYAFGVLNQPIVDQYVLIVKKALEKTGWQGPKAGRYREKSFAVMVTHDIDHTRKWTPGIIYRECVRYLVLNQRNDFIKDRILRFGHFLRMLAVQHDPYRISIDKILSAEEKTGVHATFFIKAGGNNKRDVSYSLRNAFIRRLLRILKNKGHQIGLHPSYNAYSHPEMMEKEQTALKAAMGESPGAVREHFLRFEMPLTWRIQNGLDFEYDSTLGFPGHEGFRMATCHPFRAYDLEHDRPLHLWELPLIAMDDTFVSYRKLDPAASWKAIRELLETVKKYDGVAVLLFHNSCYDDFDNQGWGSVFEKTLRWSFENNAALLNGQDALESYRKTAMQHSIAKGTRPG